LPWLACGVRRLRDNALGTRRGASQRCNASGGRSKGHCEKICQTSRGMIRVQVQPRRKLCKSEIPVKNLSKQPVHVARSVWRVPRCQQGLRRRRRCFVSIFATWSLRLPKMLRSSYSAGQGKNQRFRVNLCGPGTLDRKIMSGRG